MAALQFRATSGYVTLASATAKSCLSVQAPANQAVYVRGIRLAGAQAAGGTDAAVKARFTQTSSASGTGTTTNTQAYVQDPRISTTIQSTVKYAYSAEPTSPVDVYDYLVFNPESGLTEMWPRELWRVVPPGYTLYVELTAVSGTPTVFVELFCEE